MSKKFTIQELEEIAKEVAKEVTQSMITTDFNVLNSSKTLKKSFKTPIEKVRQHEIIVQSSPLVKLIWIL